MSNEFYEWARQRYIVAGPNEELRSPAIGFSNKSNAEEVADDASREGFDVEVIQVRRGYYVIEQEEK